MILAGLVTVDGRRVDKAGAPIAADAEVRVAGPAHPYVSRGGVKLAAALDAFALDPAGLVCLDVGASTGGFTDCLLQRGARSASTRSTWAPGRSTRSCGRTLASILREKVNARFLSSAQVPEPAALAAMDLSFISARLVLPAVVPLLSPGASLVVLVKPQFEAGRSEVPRGGVVRSEETQRRVVQEVTRAAEALGLQTLGAIASPITGAAGNREFLLAFRVQNPEVSP